MKTFLKSPAGVLVAIAALWVLMAAGITGEFTQVNSVNGYLLNGSGGSAGNALCSNGSYYGTPCTVGTITGVTASSPLTGGGTSGSVTVGLGTTGTAGTYTYPSSITTDAYGRVSAITSGATVEQSASNTSGCTTGASSYDTCTANVSWPNSFADTNYQVACTAIGPSTAQTGCSGAGGCQMGTIAGVTKGTGNVTVIFATMGGNTATASEFDCIARHN